MEDADDLQYDLELGKLIETISTKRPKNVLLQFPEGLKGIAILAKDRLEERTQTNIMISGESCFGACDLPMDPGSLGIDLIIQFGHAEMPNLKYDVPVVFVPAYSKIDVLPAVRSSTEYLKGNVGLITTIQHIHKLTEVRTFLAGEGFNVLVGEGAGRIVQAGQVLGCNLTSATSIARDVDCYLFIGSGDFHGTGVAISTNKTVFVADPYKNEIRDITPIKERMLRQRHGAITKAQEAAIFGIIVGTKPGQMRLNMAFGLKNLIEGHKKKASIFILNEISPGNFRGYSLDALVNTACPRLALDDHMMYPIPIITPFELKIVLGEKKWDEYIFDMLL